MKPKEPPTVNKPRKSTPGKTVKIACQGAASIQIDNLKPFQGELKTLSDENYAKLKNEIIDLGFSEPIAIWKSQGENFVLNGHQRLTTLLKMRGEGFAIPPVPVSIVDATSYKQAKLKVLSLTSQFGEMSPKGLLDFVADIDLKLPEMSERFDFPDVNLDAMMKAQDDEGPADEIPPTRKTNIKLGDLFELGKHRLLCGDSLQEKNDSETVVFDPPFDAERKTLKLRNHCKNVLVFTDHRHLFDCVNDWGVPFKSIFCWDCVTSWYTPGWPLARGKFCLWFGSGKYNSEGAFYGDAGENHEVTNTRGTYIYKPNPKGKHLSTVFKYPITQRGKNHPHEKPFDWVKMLIANCSSGDVYDPFSGSGTSLIACEALGRKWSGVEKEPIYCQLIIDRWEKMSLKKARLIKQKVK
jgi:site-specific DNA-methyltransferase (adenine-specific)